MIWMCYIMVYGFIMTYYGYDRDGDWNVME